MAVEIENAIKGGGEGDNKDRERGDGYRKREHDEGKWK